jgi:hypothetical protein
MTKFHWLSSSLLMAVAAVAAPASAATFNFQSTVTAVEITDDANNGPVDGVTAKYLNIIVSTPGDNCYNDDSPNVITVKNTESVLWDHWVRLAESAFLSGRKLEIWSSNSTGSCKLWSLKLLN